MKKVITLIMCILFVFLLSACSSGSSNESTSEKTSDAAISDEQDSEIVKRLCNGKWFFDTYGEGPSTGEGRYIDYITFHTDYTYEKTQLVGSDYGDTKKSVEEYKIVGNYVVIYDCYEGDYILQFDDNNDLQIIDCIGRVYESFSPKYYYIDEYDFPNNQSIGYPGYDSLEQCLAKLPSRPENEFSDVSQRTLYNVSDNLKVAIMSRTWNPCSWKSSMENPDTNIIFSHDGYCYVWNASYFDQEGASAYEEFYQTLTYKIDGKNIQISDGTRLVFDEQENQLVDSNNGVTYG